MRRTAPILLLAALAACGEPAEQPAAPAFTPDPGPRPLVSVSLEGIELGPKILGPDGEELTTVLTDTDGRTLGQMTSFVACPVAKAKDPDGQVEEPVLQPLCDPAAQPEGAVFTYVHRIGLGRPDMEAPDPAAPMPATMVFRMVRPAAGFARVVGYDHAQAEQALGPDAAIEVQLEDDAIVWRVTGGDGWADGETLTFFWQSNLPPAGPEAAYQLRIGDATAQATGPFPPVESAEPTEEAPAN